MRPSARCGGYANQESNSKKENNNKKKRSEKMATLSSSMGENELKTLTRLTIS